MSEIARIVPEDDPRLRDLVATQPEEHRADTDSWIQVVADVSKLATFIASTDFVPRSLRDSAPAVAAAILFGREVGLPPMTALTQVNVIEGRPALAAEAMRALVLAAGHELVFAETTGAICTMRARRHGSQEWTPLTWTIDMARAAGLRGPAWDEYPRAMLQARCTTEICRMVYPDVIHGFRSVEEIVDMGPDALGAPETAPTASKRTGTVQRASGQRRPPRKPPEPTPAREPDPVVPGPPLPGEPGYDTPPTQPGEGGGEEPPRPASPPLSPPAEPQVMTPPEEPAEEGPKPATRPQLNMMFALFGRLGVGDDEPGRAERLRIIGQIVGRPVSSSAHLTLEEAQTVLDTLALAGGNLQTLHTILDGQDPDTLPIEEPQ